MKTLLAALILSTLLHTKVEAQDTQSKNRFLRLSLRLNKELVLPKPNSSPLKREGLYYKWRFINFPPEELKRTKQILLTLKEKCPEHYLLACRNISKIYWETDDHSWANGSDKEIGLSIREYSWDGEKGESMYIMAVIHEIQHCNQRGDNDEGGATWAAWFYGKRMNVAPHLLKWTKGMSLGMNYSGHLAWNKQLAITKGVNDWYVREGKYE